jgi:hypothetical protein
VIAFQNHESALQGGIDEGARCGVYGMRGIFAVAALLRDREIRLEELQ